MKNKIFIYIGIGGLIFISTILIIIYLSPHIFRIGGLGGVATVANSGNGRVIFYGRIVNELGDPVHEASITVEIFKVLNSPDAPLKDKLKRIEVKSDSQGNFQIDVIGLDLKVININKDGYQWLYDKEMGGNKDYPMENNLFFSIWDHGRPVYIPIKESPAVFVLVRYGIKDVKVMPWPGGLNNNPRPHVAKQEPYPNTTKWPRKPSIDGVYYNPTINPTTMRTE